MCKLKTFIVNLERRQDRREHILGEFAKYPEFDITLINAIHDDLGSWGLWLTIKDIVNTAKLNSYEYIILCEDDHSFTKDYDKEMLMDIIGKLQMLEADILLGGVSWFGTVLPVAKNLFWVKKFNGLQFTVVFQRFYSKLLDLDIKKGQDADIEISTYSNKSFVCYPYISIQKEFGYSDITTGNSQKGYLTDIFDRGLEKLRQLNYIASYYGKI